MNLGPESETVEHKKSTSELKKGLISVSAILNKHGHGTLYFGVENNGTVIGQEIGADTARDISRGMYELIEPSPYYSVEVLDDGGKEYIKVSFEGDNVPYSADGRYYLRMSDEDRKMTRDTLINLVMSVSDGSGWERMSTEHTNEDADEELLITYFKMGQDSGRINERYDRDSFLSKTGLSVNGYLTNAGHLLLSKRRPVRLNLALFAGDDKVTFLDRRNFDGNILECIKEAEMFILKNIRWKAEFSGFRRVDVPEIPVGAIREIVINSFAHARYRNISTEHAIDITPGSIEIYNPGRLLPKIVPEDYLRGDKRSEPTNPTIAEFMLRCNLIEKYGTGFRKTITLCNENDVFYDYYNGEQGFTFEFLRDPLYVNDNTSILKGSELEVYELMKKDDKITAESIGSRIGRDPRTVFRHIDGLKEKGLVRREGNVRTGRWVVSPVAYRLNRVPKNKRKEN